MNQSNPENDGTEYRSTEFAELVELARSGDKQATGKLIDRWRKYLLLIANENLDQDLHTKIGPSDIVQQSMLDAQENIADFRGSSEAEFQAWVRQILRNNVHSARRKYKSAKRRDLRLEMGINDSRNHPPAILDGQETPRSQALRNERASLLNAAMRKLPDHYQQVIQLRNWDELTFVEIANQIGGTEETARKLWSRAVLRLQKVIKDEHPGFQSGSIHGSLE